MPLEHELEEDIKGRVDFIDFKNVVYLDTGRYWDWVLPSLNEMYRRFILVRRLLCEGDNGAVPLIGPVQAVVEIITDQL